MRPTFFNPEHQKSLQEKGYAIVDLLPAAAVAELMKAIEQLKPDDGFNPAPAKNRPSDYHCTFLDTNQDYKRAANALIMNMFRPYLEKILDRYRILNGNFYIKQPGKGNFEIHQNWTHVLDWRSTTVTVWCPLVDVNEENGTIQIVEGSHKILPTDLAVAGMEQYFLNFEKALREVYLKPIPLKAGQCIIFDDSLIHYSAQNNGKEPRIAIQIETLPEEITPVFYHHPKENPSVFEVYEIDFDYFIEENISTMLKRPTRLCKIGVVPNENKFISEQEFLELMKKGNETRKVAYY